MLIHFDCETGPRPEASEFIRPFEAPGGWKDPVKIEEARLLYEAKELDKAALDPMTAQILMITVESPATGTMLMEHMPDEKAMLAEFWRIVTRETLATLCGYCSETFDLPMLFARSWVHGLNPPSYLRRGRYFSDYSLDLFNVWMCGRKPSKEGPKNDLGTVARLLGVGEKSMGGEKFHLLYANDRSAAIQYALNDLALTVKIQKRLIPIPQ